MLSAAYVDYYKIAVCILTHFSPILPERNITYYTITAKAHGVFESGKLQNVFYRVSGQLCQRERLFLALSPQNSLVAYSKAEICGPSLTWVLLAKEYKLFV